MKHPFLIGAGVLTSLFVAYEVWGRSAGDKASIGDTVRVDFKDITLTPSLTALFPQGLGAGTFGYILITAIDATSGAITGRLVRVQFPSNAVALQTTQVMVATNRKAVLPLAYGAQPVPVETI